MSEHLAAIDGRSPVERSTGKDGIKIPRSEDS